MNYASVFCVATVAVWGLKMKPIGFAGLGDFFIVYVLRVEEMEMLGKRLERGE